MTVTERFKKKCSSNDCVILFHCRVIKTFDFVEEDFLWFAMSRQWRKKYVVISITWLQLLTGPRQFGNLVWIYVLVNDLSQLVIL